MAHQPQALTMNGESLDIKQQQLNQLREIIPGLFAEGKLDWEKLKSHFGDDINFNNERYVLNWAGKADAFRVLQTPTTATLQPAPEESVNFDTTENVFIEGENLEVLKILQKSYYNRIKCIIIDPPYNTGNDSFIYPDNFKESREEYQKRIGDKDEEGYLMREGMFRKNSKDSGHYHSNWLSMMYPRLFLARNLLKDDGVIFVFIDDNEVHNLRLLMNEVFGEENFLADIIWEKRYTRSNDAKFFASVIDHVLVFRKSFALESLKQPRTQKSNDIYSNPDNDPRGNWTSVSYVSQRTKTQRQNLTYKIENPFTKKLVEHPTNAWKFSLEQNKKHIENNQLWWGKDGAYQFPRLKKFLTELPDGMVPTNLWKYQDAGTVDDGTKEVDSIIGKDIFDYPKPTSVIKKILSMALTENHDDIVLDFFAGSGTLAQSLFELVNENSPKKRFILVQLPEICNDSSEAFKAGYSTIAEISKERIRRVISKIQTEKNQKPGLFDNDNQDLGFKVFKLTPSNFKIWRPDEITEENLATTLDLFADPVLPETREADILIELMLKAGCMLTDKVEHNGRFYSIAGGELAIVLQKWDAELVKEVLALQPQKCITLDNCFQHNDQLKTNTVLQMRDAGIDFKTI